MPRRRTLQLPRWNMVVVSLEVALKKRHGNEVTGGWFESEAEGVTNGLDVGYERETRVLCLGL